MNESVSVKKEPVLLKAQLEFWERKVQKWMTYDLQARNQEKFSDRLAFHLNKIQTCGYESIRTLEDEN